MMRNNSTRTIIWPRHAQGPPVFCLAISQYSFPGGFPISNVAGSLQGLQIASHILVSIADCSTNKTRHPRWTEVGCTPTREQSVTWKWKPPCSLRNKVIHSSQGSIFSGQKWPSWHQGITTPHRQTNCPRVSMDLPTPKKLSSTILLMDKILHHFAHTFLAALVLPR